MLKKIFRRGKVISNGDLVYVARNFCGLGEKQKRAQGTSADPWKPLNTLRTKNNIRFIQTEYGCCLSCGAKEKFTILVEI